jgi:uncharacterized membrane protein YccC
MTKLAASILGHRSKIGSAVVHSTGMGVACAISYEVTTQSQPHLYSVSKADGLVGGLWAVVATAFVYRTSYEESEAAALTRMTATLLSFALCLVYLLVFPFHVWGLAVLIGIGTLVLTLIGRPNYVVTATVGTAVIMVSAAVSPHDPWRQPILRLANTAVGVAVGLAAAWIGLRLSSRE